MKCPLWILNWRISRIEKSISSYQTHLKKYSTQISKHRIKTIKEWIRQDKKLLTELKRKRWQTHLSTINKRENNAK